MCETNPYVSAAHSVDHCISKNLESYEYKKGEFVSSGCCTCSATKKKNCGSYSVDYGNSYQSDCNSARDTDCYMYYRHRYVLKDLKIKVNITDTEYMYYNTDDGTWDQMSFVFYVTAPLVDDNCCNGKVCSDEEREEKCSNPFDSPDIDIIFEEDDSDGSSSVIEVETEDTSSDSDEDEDSGSVNIDNIEYIPGL